MNQIGPINQFSDLPSGCTPAIFEQIVGQFHDCICLQDLHGRVEWANPACETLFGWRWEEVQGQFARDLITPPERRQRNPDNRVFTYDLSSKIFDQDVIQEFQRRDGTLFWLQQSFAILDLGTGDAQKKIMITCRDVTSQVNTDNRFKEVHANLEHAAYHDELTGLGNRKKLAKFLRSDPVRAAIRYQTLGVLQIDIDKFKEVNDTHGHTAGDATLRHVAAALRQACGAGSLACRTGGDEFLLIYLAPGGPSELIEHAEALMKAIARPLRWKNGEIRIGASIGVSVATSPSDTGEELILRADKALYSAKTDGRGRVELYTEAMGQQFRARMNTIHDLKRALAENQFEVHLQPQFHLPTNKVTGCEALIRWNHPERGILNPAQFLPEAEQAGLTAELDYVAMNLSLDALVELSKGGFPDLTMSINVSSAILDDMNYPGLLHWAMQSRNIDPKNICMEILETTILEGGNLEIVTAIERLKHLGLRIALDDFGTGYAGLAHMSAFDVDAIKLDRSMVARLANDPRNRVIIRSTIRLCDLLGISVVAEGVETHEQFEILRRAHCPLIQGFGLARPMPLERTLNWLKESAAPVEAFKISARPKAQTIPLDQRRK